MARRHQRPDDFACAQQDGLDAKKKTYRYQERDEAKRQAFVAQVASLTPVQLVYVDEAGMDNRDNYGYGAL